MTKRVRFAPVITVLSVGVAVGLSAGQAHWPQWRGPALNGVSAGGAPIEWSDSRNVGWRIEIPGRGFSSPVVWGDKLTYQVLATNTVGGQSFIATPLVAAGDLYLRSRTHLFRIARQAK